MKKYLSVILTAIIVFTSIFTFAACTPQNEETEETFWGEFKYDSYIYQCKRYYLQDELGNYILEDTNIEYFESALYYPLTANNAEIQEKTTIFKMNVTQQGYDIYLDIREYFGKYVKVYNTKMVFYNENNEQILEVVYVTPLASYSENFEGRPYIYKNTMPIGGYKETYDEYCAKYTFSPKEIEIDDNGFKIYLGIYNYNATQSEPLIQQELAIKFI